jgi:hypothetical protein
MADGAFLHVYNPATGDSACFTLVNGHWLAKGNAANPAFKYSDKAFTSSACKTAAVKDAKQLKVSCQAKVQPISYSLDEPSQGSVAVIFGSGTTRYCAVFGGTIKRDSGSEGAFSALAAPAPASCPTPPAPCP